MPTCFPELFSELGTSTLRCVSLAQVVLITRVLIFSFSPLKTFSLSLRNLVMKELGMKPKTKRNLRELILQLILCHYCTDETEVRFFFQYPSLFDILIRIKDDDIIPEEV